MNRFPSHWQLQAAARWIREGGIIAYPTESVFGLGCDPAVRCAVERLLTLKRRSVAKGLILIASDWKQLQPWLGRIPSAWHAQLQRSWPGPTTWLIPASKHCPDWLTGRHDTLAVRVSAHPLVRRLCKSLDRAIVSTSANRSGQQPARSVLEVRLRFGCQIDFVLPGQVGTLEKPTEIRDLASGTVVRN